MPRFRREQFQDKIVNGLGVEQSFIAVCKTLCALINQVRQSSTAGLAIEFSPLFKNFVRKGGGQTAAAVELRSYVDWHIFGEADSAQTALSALHPADRAFVAGGQDDHQVHITVLGGRAPSARAEEPDLLRLKF